MDPANATSAAPKLVSVVLRTLHNLDRQEAEQCQRLLQPYRMGPKLVTVIVLNVEAFRSIQVRVTI